MSTLAASGNSSSSSKRSAYCSLSAQTCVTASAASAPFPSPRLSSPPTYLLLERSHSRLHLAQAHPHHLLPCIPIRDRSELADILGESLAGDDLGERVGEDGAEEEVEVGEEVGRGFKGAREEGDEGGTLGTGRERVSWELR